MNELEKLYNDPEKTSQNSDVLYSRLSGNAKKVISYKHVKEFIEKQKSTNLHKQANKRIYAPIGGEIGTYQTDLTFFPEYKSQNDGYYVLITAIEINSRQGYAIALKRKNAASILMGFEKIINEARNHIPVRVVGSDKGREFEKYFREFLKDNEIEYYTVDPVIGKNSMAMVERFNRTLRERIERYLTQRGDTKWVEALPKILKNYNNTKNGTTGYAPYKVGEEEMRDIARKQAIRLAEYFRDVKKYEIGDKVRILLQKSLVEKKSGVRWSKEVYTITKNNGFSYTLDGLSGNYKPYQLLTSSDEGRSERILRSTVSRDANKQEYKAGLRLRRENLS